MTSPFAIFVRSLATASRRTRRLLVAGAFLGYPLLNVGYIALVLPGRASSVAWAPVAVLLFGATLVGIVGIYGYARGRADLRPELDERQRQVRDQAWIHAYELVIVAVTIVVAGLAVATTLNGPLTIGMNELTPVIIGIGLYLPLLPAATLTWSEPDPPVDFDDNGPDR